MTHPTPYMSVDDASRFPPVRPGVIHPKFIKTTCTIVGQQHAATTTTTGLSYPESLRASNYTIALSHYLSVFSRRPRHARPRPRPLPRHLARGSGLAGSPCGTAAVAWCACFEKDTSVRHQSNGKIGIVTIRALSKERSLSSFLLSWCLCLSLASSHLSLSIQGKGHGLTPMIWIGAPPLPPRLSSPSDPLRLVTLASLSEPPFSSTRRLTPPSASLSSSTRGLAPPSCWSSLSLASSPSSVSASVGGVRRGSR